METPRCNNDHEDVDFSTKDRLELERLEEEEALARSVDDWFTLGVNAFLAGAYEQAISYFDHILDKDPNNARAYVHRGDVHRECGDYDEALDDYEMAVYLGSPQAVAIRDEFKNELSQLKSKNKR